MSPFFQFVDQRNGVVGKADLALSGFILDQLIGAETKLARPEALENEGCRGEKCPVDIGDAAQIFEGCDASLGRRFLGFREIWRIDYPDTGGDFETARPSNHDRAVYPGIM